LRATIPQKTLDALTDIAMPRLPIERPSKETVPARGFSIPVYRSEALVLGSGAAGLRAAVEMKRRDVDVVVASQSAYGGTSACSGSDKQTLHTANGAGRGDDLGAMADALGAGGAMDEDTAYIEAVGSLRALSSLQFIGLPIPQDRLGGVLRYQTDHDEVGRATSCGPRTSRLMVQVLAREAIRLNVPIFNHTTGVRLLVEPGGRPRCLGALAMSTKRRANNNPLGLVVFLSESVVIATGGPGELYRDSVYPRHCFGSLGLALEAGLEAVNLTESQFGIGTSRDSFPWNLSGTYVQAMPCIFSRDSRGNERNFLADYYRTTQELASNVFRKGYQWPFHATRMLEFGSSLVDLAIVKETRSGRKVFMDFNRNPLPVPGDAEFDLNRLDLDVRAYLSSAGALLEKPIDRLREMNPLSIELYKRYKYDITSDPLEFAVNNQHMNGGLAVDRWGATSLEGCYAVGEAAGTHGATRPGGAALNAGQVFGARCAEHVAARRGACAESASLHGLIDEAVGRILDVLKADSALTFKSIRKDVQDRMSDHAGVLCNAADVKKALAAAAGLNKAIRQQGIAHSGASEALKALQWRQTALLSEAVLNALAFYIARGGGSRGARAICTPEGNCIPEARIGRLEEVRFVSERADDRAEKIHVRLDEGAFVCEARPIRRRDRADKPFFERFPDRRHSRSRSLTNCERSPCDGSKMDQQERSRRRRSDARIRSRRRGPLPAWVRRRHLEYLLASGGTDRPVRQNRLFLRRRVGPVVGELHRLP
jgi:succinate dehydrogenase / fumarate reductase flavoprotein subunit